MNFLHNLVCIYEHPNAPTPTRFTIGHLTYQHMTQLWFSDLDEAIDMVTSGDVNQYVIRNGTDATTFATYLRGITPHTYILDGQVISYSTLLEDYPELLI